MNTYMLLSKLLPSQVYSPDEISEMGNKVSKNLQKQFPKIKWLSNYAVCGPYDFVDIFEAETNEMAMKVAVIIRSSWNAITELWPVIPTDLFKSFILNFEENIHEKQPAEDIVDEVSMDSFPASDPPSSSSIT
jgi:uncharacterized protein with GYD domain